jgi:hypothetical protein
MASEATGNGWAMVAAMPAKDIDVQAAMKTHLSQSNGAGAFDGQHGISPAISSITADGDISCAIGCIESCGEVSAITGRETGAKARPAIIKTASNRRMVKRRCTGPEISILCYDSGLKLDKDLAAPSQHIFSSSTFYAGRAMIAIKAR